MTKRELLNELYERHTQCFKLIMEKTSKNATAIIDDPECAELSTRADTYFEIYELIRNSDLTSSVKSASLLSRGKKFMKNLFALLVGMMLISCASKPVLSKWEEYKLLCDGGSVSSFRDNDVTIHCQGSEQQTFSANPSGKAIISTVKTDYVSP